MAAAPHAMARTTLLVPAVERVREDVRGGAATVETTPPTVLNDGRPLYEINRAVIGTLIPRGLFEREGGFDDSLDALEDWELWLRCEKAGAELVDVPEAVYRAYMRHGSRNADQSLYRQIRQKFDPLYTKREGTK